MQIIVGPTEVEWDYEDQYDTVLFGDAGLILPPPSRDVTIRFGCPRVAITIYGGKYTVEEKLFQHPIHDDTSSDEILSLEGHLQIPEAAKRFIIGPLGKRVVRWQWFIVTIKEGN